MSRRGDNIHKRNDGRWEGRYKKGRKSNGAVWYGSVYGKSYREVKDKLAFMSLNPAPEKQAKDQAETFGDILELWMQNNQVRLKGGTINKYRRLIDAHIIKELGTVKISDMTAVTINSFLTEKLINGRIAGNGGLSPSYVRSIMLIITAALKYAVSEQLCSPMKSPISKPAVQRKELVILDYVQQKKLKACLVHEINPTKAGIMISLYMGLRIGEVCALRWEDIDFADRIIHIRHTVARIYKTGENSGKRSDLIIDSPKTKTSKRDIPIPSVLFPILENLRNLSESEYVVSDTSGFVSPRTYEYRYHQILKKCGIKGINYHALRHTFATRCVEAGVDIKSLSEILGHSNVSITLNTYVHSSMELKRTQLEKITSVSI